MFICPVPSVMYFFFPCKITAKRGRKTCKLSMSEWYYKHHSLLCAIYIYYNQHVLWLRNKAGFVTLLYLLTKQGTAFRWCWCFALLNCWNLARGPEGSIFLSVLVFNKVGRKEMMEKVILYPISISFCLLKVCNNVAVYMQMMLIRRFWYQLCQRLHSLYTLNLHLKRAVIINI